MPIRTCNDGGAYDVKPADFHVIWLSICYNVVQPQLCNDLNHDSAAKRFSGGRAKPACLTFASSSCLRAADHLQTILFFLLVSQHDWGKQHFVEDSIHVFTGS